MEDGRSPLVLGVEDAVRRFALPASAEEVSVVAAELGPRSELLGTLADALTRGEDVVPAASR